MPFVDPGAVSAVSDPHIFLSLFLLRMFRKTSLGQDHVRVPVFKPWVLQRQQPGEAQGPVQPSQPQAAQGLPEPQCDRPSTAMQGKTVLKVQ